MKALDTDANRREELANDRSRWRDEAKPSRGMRPNDSKLQKKEERDARAARQQLYPTQPTDAAAATETVTLQ